MYDVQKCEYEYSYCIYMDTLSNVAPGIFYVRLIVFNRSYVHVKNGERRKEDKTEIGLLQLQWWHFFYHENYELRQL